MRNKSNFLYVLREMTSNMFITIWIWQTNNCFMTVTEQWNFALTLITCARYNLFYLLENHWYRSLQGCHNEHTGYNISSPSDYIWVRFTRTGRMLRWSTRVRSYLMLFYIKKQLSKRLIIFNLCLKFYIFLFTNPETLKSVVTVIMSLEIPVRVNKLKHKCY